MPVKRGILLMYQHNKIFEKTDRKDNLLTSCALHYASNDICGIEPTSLSVALWVFAGNSQTHK